MALFCGIDFGTSNSVVSVVNDNGEIVHTRREPTLIYFKDDPETTSNRACGHEALSRYLADGMSGRFFQSIKTMLPDPLFTHTVVNGKRFTAEDLVAVMLRFLRERVESAVGVSVKRAVVGRPARFSEDDSHESLAQTRLERAADQAGFEEVEFEFEPAAGARSYLSRTDGESTVFVADHGGGTSDFTVMKLTRTGVHEVLATYGIRAGGDDFDAEIMWNRLVHAFGYESSYESFGKQLPVPVHIFRIISRWDQIHFLKTTKYREELTYYLRSSDNPLAIRRLIKLVEENLGYFITRAVERAKIELSSRDIAVIDYRKDKLKLHEEISREQFERYISSWISRISEAVETTLGMAGVSPEEIDAVFMTGGSSSVPAVQEVMSNRFPSNALVGDERKFDSVAEGLALAARARNLSVE